MPAAKGDWKWKFLVGPLVTLTIVGVGFLGSWYTVKANVGELKTDQARIEDRVDRHEDEITDIKIKDARNSQVIENIGDTLQKIEQQTSQIPKIQADVQSLKDKIN